MYIIKSYLYSKIEQDFPYLYMYRAYLCTYHKNCDFHKKKKFIQRI